MLRVIHDEQLSAIASAIRAQSGKSEGMTVSEMPQEIAQIGASGSDERRVYRNSRPAEWLRLPEYETVEDNAIYFLAHVYPVGVNTLRLGGQFKSVPTLSVGLCPHGVFEPIEQSDSLSLALDYASLPQENMLSGGIKQVIIRVLCLPGACARIQFDGGTWDNAGLKDMLCSLEPTESYFFNQGQTNRSINYFYSKGSQTVPLKTSGVRYAASAQSMQLPPSGSAGFSGVGDNLEALMCAQDDVLIPNSGRLHETFRGCGRLRELRIDISALSYWSNPFRGSCASLARLLFVGGEALSSFPGDINLNPCALDAQGVLDFFNTLPDISASGESRTITLTGSPAASQGLPQTTLDCATGKGWTVVTA